MDGQKDDMDGERLKSGAGNKGVELTKTRRLNGNVEDLPKWTSGIASSSELLMTWTSSVGIQIIGNTPLRYSKVIKSP